MGNNSSFSLWMGSSSSDCRKVALRTVDLGESSRRNPGGCPGCPRCPGVPGVPSVRVSPVSGCDVAVPGSGAAGAAAPPALRTPRPSPAVIPQLSDSHPDAVPVLP